MSRQVASVVQQALVAGLCMTSFAGASPITLGGEGDVQPTATVAPVPPEFQQAIEYFRQGKLEDCRRVLEEAYEANGDLDPPEVLLAGLFEGAQRLDVARRLVDEAATHHPNRPEGFLNLGNIAVSEGRIAEAQLDYNHALALCEKAPVSEKRRTELREKALWGIALVADRRGDHAAAEAALARVLETSPENSNYRQRYARALFFQDRVKDAWTQLQRMVDNGENPTPGMVMASFFTEKKNWPKAEEWIDYIIKKDTDTARARLFVAAWYLQRGMPAEAKPHAEEAARLGANRDVITGLQGSIARCLEDYPAAEKAFQTIYDANPGNILNTSQLALALAEQSDPAKIRRAQQLAEINQKLAERSPYRGVAQATYGWILYKAGRKEEGIALLEPVVQSGGVTADIAYYWANVLADRGHTDRARDFLSRAVASEGVFPQREAARAWLERLEKDGSGEAGAAKPPVEPPSP